MILKFLIKTKFEFCIKTEELWMKKQRWRLTKVKKCDICGNKVDVSKLYGINYWTYKNRPLYRCFDCVSIGF